MTIRALHCLLPAVVLLASCRETPEAGHARIQATDAWARATAPGQDTGGIFLQLHNRGDVQDRLLSVSTPAARSVQIHDMTMDGAVMRMRPKETLDMPAGGSVKLSPGGTHLMLVGLKAPLKVGATIPLSLQFEKAGGTDVEVMVRLVGATGPRDAGDE